MVSEDRSVTCAHIYRGAKGQVSDMEVEALGLTPQSGKISNDTIFKDNLV